MCWLTVDRALKLAAEFGRAPGGATLRDPIAARAERGWNDEVLVHRRLRRQRPRRRHAAHRLSGLIDPTTAVPRHRRASEAELRSGPTVYRYHRDDGLPGPRAASICARRGWSRRTCSPAAVAGRGAVRPAVTAAGPTGPAARGVRPGGRARAGQPPAGLQPPRAAALRAAPRRLSAQTNVWRERSRRNRQTSTRANSRGGPEVRPRTTSVSSTSITGSPDRGGLCSSRPARRPFSRLGCTTVVRPRRNASGRRRIRSPSSGPARRSRGPQVVHRRERQHVGRAHQRGDAGD